MTKIYILTINQIESNSHHAVISSYVSPRHERKVEYYASKTGAEKRRDEIYDGIQKLVGFLDNVEVVITEKEVNP